MRMIVLRRVVTWAFTCLLGGAIVGCGESSQEPCDYEGVSHNSGETFYASDGCNTCMCGDAGLVDCTKIACESCYGATSEDGCSSIGHCRWLTPGCAGFDQLAIPMGCYPNSNCGSDSDCPGALVCLDVVYNPCPPNPGGANCDACGGYIRACVDSPEH